MAIQQCGNVRPSCTAYFHMFWILFVYKSIRILFIWLSHARCNSSPFASIFTILQATCRFAISPRCKHPTVRSSGSKSSGHDPLVDLPARPRSVWSHARRRRRRSESCVAERMFKGWIEGLDSVRLSVEGFASMLH